MGDIVERLRAGFFCREEAADEIEGLRLEHQHACQEISVAIAERDQAIDLLYSLLGLEPGSGEKALAFIESFRPPGGET